MVLITGDVGLEWEIPMYSRPEEIPGTQGMSERTFENLSVCVGGHPSLPLRQRGWVCLLCWVLRVTLCLLTTTILTASSGSCLASENKRKKKSNQRERHRKRDRKREQSKSEKNKTEGKNIFGGG